MDSPAGDTESKLGSIVASRLTTRSVLLRGMRLKKRGGKCTDFDNRKSGSCTRPNEGISYGKGKKGTPRRKYFFSRE